MFTFNIPIVTSFIFFFKNSFSRNFSGNSRGYTTFARYYYLKHSGVF